MSLIDELLSKLLAEQISDEDAEAPEGAELGRIAFAPKRPHKPFEKNTKIEKMLATSLFNYIHKNRPLSAEQVQLIRKFLANGWYSEVFAKPEVDIIYRVMAVNKTWLKTALNLRKNEDIPDKGIIEIPFTFISRKPVSSWSQVENILSHVSITSKAYGIKLFAKLADNPSDGFITCVNNIYDLVNTDYYKKQAEVISLVPMVKVFKIQWNKDDHSPGWLDSKNMLF